MPDAISNSIGESLHNFQAALNQDGQTLADFIDEHYVRKWRGEELFHVMAIRTSFVSAIESYLADRGLFNLERVSISPVTDPLAHDVEHTPAIFYKGHTYLTTHSMIYSKFLACFNRQIRGIYVDSPNIRLEIESPSGVQRNKYLIDFSQIDIELRRNRFLGLREYLDECDRVTEILQEDFEQAIAFFEDMIVACTSAVATKNADSLNALGIALEVPCRPFPRYRRDEAMEQLKTTALEKPLGKRTQSQFFWIVGLMRENYDLIYPYLKADGSKVPLSDFSSGMIYNYDLCAQSLQRHSGSYGPAFEVLSGGIREWLYEPIVERLIDNKILAVRPSIHNGDIENIDELGGYGPFLLAVYQKDEEGKPLFPETFGGGIGVERSLFALLCGENIQSVDQVTFFGKNPDSFPLYLY